MRARIGITLGDPGGIGPEVLLKSLHKTSGRYVVFGSSKVLLHHSAKLQLPFDPSRVELIDIDNVPEPYFGAVPQISGPASIEYLNRAFESFQLGNISALVTGPIHKESWHASGFAYPGQTEYCAEKTGRSRFCMIMVGRKFRIALLSTHLSLQAALHEVEKNKIADQIRLIHEEFVKLGYSHPRIACAALNPHAGEKGAFGLEELDQIEPALEQVRSEGILVEGPVAPEVVFRVAATKGSWDVILAMYHDQAMIPLKLLEF
ncbi:MAG TPA: 4-hydroxythreonine-4-phosphate dehydrogenase PdxA, partial [Anaerolineales bacterium]|nr:4-hydroxythreonine-4-phosphate dehydrogenase PdxA [Anaerolineales bacterium]